MKLYWGSGSPVSWRVQLGLLFKGLEYDSHRLDLGNREHRSEAYRAINPRGTFPVLVDGDLVIRDSIAILAYLDRRYPDNPLFGGTPVQAAKIWERVAEHDDGLGASVTTITQALFREGGLDDPAPAKAAVAASHAELTEMEQGLGDGEWLESEAPSAAEAVYYPTVQRLLRAAGKPAASSVGLILEALPTTYPQVIRWLERLKKRRGVDETYPPHWR